MAKRTVREADEMTKWKMSLRKQQNANPNYGKPRDETTKAKIAQSMRDYWQSVPSIHDGDDNNDKKK